MVVLMRWSWHWKWCKLILETHCEVLLKVIGWLTDAQWMSHHWEDGSKLVIRIVYWAPACIWNSILNHHRIRWDRERWEWCS